MKQNEDGKTVGAMDVLFPQIGEIIGGSQREENLEKLLEPDEGNECAGQRIVVVPGYTTFWECCPQRIRAWI